MLPELNISTKNVGKYQSFQREDCSLQSHFERIKITPNSRMKTGQFIFQRKFTSQRKKTWTLHTNAFLKQTHSQSLIFFHLADERLGRNDALFQASVKQMPEIRYVFAGSIRIFRILKIHRKSRKKSYDYNFFTNVGQCESKGSDWVETGKKLLRTDRWKDKASQTSRVKPEAPTLCAPFSVSPTIDNQKNNCS